MIHASYGQKKIVIANFNDSYYQKAYVNARRVSIKKFLCVIKNYNKKID